MGCCGHDNAPLGSINVDNVLTIGVIISQSRRILLQGIGQLDKIFWQYDE